MLVLCLACGTAAMGGSASSQLDEGKCAYIRGTTAPPGLQGGAEPGLT